MFIISAVETSLLKKTIVPFFILFFILLFLVPIIGIEVKGAKRWLDLYFFRLQPIELLKPFFILATVKILTLNKFQRIKEGDILIICDSIFKLGIKYLFKNFLFKIRKLSIYSCF